MLVVGTPDSAVPPAAAEGPEACTEVPGGAATVVVPAVSQRQWEHGSLLVKKPWRYKAHPKA